MFISKWKKCLLSFTIKLFEARDQISVANTHMFKECRWINYFSSIPVIVYNQIQTEKLLMSLPGDANPFLRSALSLDDATLLSSVDLLRAPLDLLEIGWLPRTGELELCLTVKVMFLKIIKGKQRYKHCWI